MIPEKIQKWFESDNFPQRVLLSGGSNQGLSIALEIAAKLQNTTPERILSGTHTDTVVFQDLGKSFKIDYSDTAKKDGQTEYENVRGLIKWAHRTPAEAPYRIAILENMERVSRESPHALLKLIEEPPRRTLFLFTTKNHHTLLQTIISRMTIVQLPKSDDDFVVQQDIVDLLTKSDLIQRFRYLEDTNKAAKENRNIWKDLALDFLNHARHIPALQPKLEIFFETHRAIHQNINPRFTLERLFLKLDK